MIQKFLRSKHLTGEGSITGGHHEFPGFSKRFTGSPRLHVPSIISSFSGNLLSCGVQPPTPPSTLPSHLPARHVTGPPPPPPPPRTPWATGQRAAAPAPARAPAHPRPRARPRASARSTSGGGHFSATRLTPKSKRLRCPGGRSGWPFPAVFGWFTGREPSFRTPKSLLLSGPSLFNSRVTTFGSLRYPRNSNYTTYYVMKIHRAVRSPRTSAADIRRRHRQCGRRRRATRLDLLRAWTCCMQPRAPGPPRDSRIRTPVSNQSPAAYGRRY